VLEYSVQPKTKWYYKQMGWPRYILYGLLMSAIASHIVGDYAQLNPSSLLTLHRSAVDTGG
jgi:hypothetical protein